MAHEVLASLRVALPDTPEDMARMLGGIASKWAEFIGEIGDATKVQPEASFSVNEIRARAATGVKRGRKPKEQKPAEAIADILPPVFGSIDGLRR